MKGTMMIVRNIKLKLNDTSKYALQRILEDPIDSDFSEMFYDELTGAEKIVFLNIVLKQFEEAIKEEIEKVLKKG